VFIGVHPCLLVFFFRSFAGTRLPDEPLLKDLRHQGINALKKIVVAAMSGGVDSTVAAALLLKQGFKVIGVTLRLQTCHESSAFHVPSGHPETMKSAGLNPQLFEAEHGSSSSEDAITSAKKAADRLGIDHHVLDCREIFENAVMRHSWKEYIGGRTPNPCAVCNDRIKFGVMLDYARQIGAEKMATGHYARIGFRKNGDLFLMRGADPRKDQSYFLFAISSDRLSQALFPVGGHTKDEIRSIARGMGLPNADREESQDACFATKGTTFPEALRVWFKECLNPGPLLDEEGRTLGMHEGIYQFTVGQRRGLGVTLGTPAWVKSIDPGRSAVILTTKKEELFSRGLIAAEVRWHAFRREFKRIRCLVQTRYNQTPVAASVERIEPETVSVLFERPMPAVTPGQAAVFYSGNRLLGGGWISRAL
jgi:tRNA-specific 2-thiouridylase